VLVSRIEYSMEKRQQQERHLTINVAPSSLFFSSSLLLPTPFILSLHVHFYLQISSPGPLALLARIGVRSSFAVLIIQASMAATISISYKPSYSILCLLGFIEHEYYTTFHLAAAILTKVKFVGRFLRVYAKPPSQPYVQRFLFLNTTIGA